MQEVLITVSIFFVVIAITAVLFVGWVAVRIFSFVVRAIFGLPHKPQAPVPVGHARCPREKCRADNPASASFCRRCGARLKPAQSTMGRQAAMW